MSVEDCREVIRLYIQKCSVSDIQVESLTVALTDFFDSQLLKTPVRGTLCDHIQCFSLENMSFMMHKAAPRKWRCPICKAKCFEFIIDSYQMMIITLIRKHSLPIEELKLNSYANVDKEELIKIMT